MEQQNATQQSNSDAIKPSGKSRRGFASMDKDRHKLVSSKGGKTERSKSTSNRDVRPSPTEDGYL